MVLLKRVMWPHKGEELAIYENGALLIDGHVIHMDDKSITVLGRNSQTVVVPAQKLSDGIDNGSMTVKKKTGPLSSR
jgi:hypothetical protein